MLLILSVTCAGATSTTSGYTCSSSCGYGTSSYTWCYTLGYSFSNCASNSAAGGCWDYCGYHFVKLSSCKTDCVAKPSCSANNYGSGTCQDDYACYDNSNSASGNHCSGSPATTYSDCTMSTCPAAPSTPTGGSPSGPSPSTNPTNIFTVTALTNNNTGRCLDVSGGSTTDGVILQSYDCNTGNNNQAWIYRNDGSLYNSASAKCLDVLAAGTSSGTTIDGYHCNGTPAQVWTVAFVSATGALVTFINPNSNLCLDSMAGTNNAAMKLNTCSSSSASQRFQLTSAAVTALKAVSAGSVPLWTVPAVATPSPSPAPAAQTPSSPAPASQAPANNSTPSPQPAASSPNDGGSQTVYVTALATLGGYSVSTFGTQEANQFKNAVISALGASVTYQQVAITSVTAAAGRHLLQSSVNVAFTVTTTSSAASNIANGMSSNLSSSTLNAAGLTACSSLSVSTPSAGSTAPYDITSSGSLPNTIMASASSVIKPVACIVGATFAAAALL